MNRAASVFETHSPAIPSRRNPLVFPPRERFALLLPVMSLLQTASPARDSEPTLKKPPAVRWHPGWVILGIASVGVFMSAPGQSYSVAAFIDPMLVELHLNRTEYSAAYLVATLLGGLTLPWVGRKVDQFGARKMLPIVAVLLGLACVWMGNIQHIVGLYIGFSMIRCLGQGSLTLISTWLIGEWFEHRRGLATGIVGLGGALSVMFFPRFNNLLIGQFGWRNAWMILAATVWVVLVFPGILFIRNRPEDIGLLPDWKKPGDKNPPSEQQHGEKKNSPRSHRTDNRFLDRSGSPTNSHILETGRRRGSLLDDRHRADFSPDLFAGGKRRFAWERAGSVDRAGDGRHFDEYRRGLSDGSCRGTLFARL